MLDPEKILIIRFSSIGDIVLASPLIRGLRSRFPKAQMDFAVKAEYADLVRFNHHLSSVIELKTTESSELRALKTRIRNEQYDVILDIHNSLRSRFIRLLSGAKRVSVINKRVLQRFALITLKWNLYDGVVSAAERYLEAARAFGIHDDGKGLEIFIPDETLFGVSSMMSKHRLDRFDAVIGIAPSAKHSTKMWLQERFVETSTEIAHAHNAKILLFGGPDDISQCNEITEQVNNTVGKETAMSFAGKLSLLETAAALDFCDVVLCNDTGVMHLAAARQRPVIAIFGPTVREFGFFPYGTRAEVVEHPDLPCRPCTHIGSERCPKGHFRCMKDIGPDQVLSAMATMLAQPGVPVRQPTVSYPKLA